MDFILKKDRGMKMTMAYTCIQALIYVMKNCTCTLKNIITIDHELICGQRGFSAIPLTFKA